MIFFQAKICRIFGDVSLFKQVKDDEDYKFYNSFPYYIKRQRNARRVTGTEKFREPT